MKILGVITLIYAIIFIIVIKKQLKEYEMELKMTIEENVDHKRFLRNLKNKIRDLKVINITVM